jgi:hypothetical protein
VQFLCTNVLRFFTIRSPDVAVIRTFLSSRLRSTMPSPSKPTVGVRGYAKARRSSSSGGPFWRRLDRATRRAKASGRGSVFTPSDFLDTANRASIDPWLSVVVNVRSRQRRQQSPDYEPRRGVRTENLIRVDDVMESPMLAE